MPPASTTHNISTLNIREINAASVIIIRNKSHGIFNPNRRVVTRRSPTKEDNIPFMALLNQEERLRLLNHGSIPVTMRKEGENTLIVAISPPIGP